MGRGSSNSAICANGSFFFLNFQCPGCQGRTTCKSGFTSGNQGACIPSQPVPANKFVDGLLIGKRNTGASQVCLVFPPTPKDDSLEIGCTLRYPSHLLPRLMPLPHSPVVTSLFFFAFFLNKESQLLGITVITLHVQAKSIVPSQSPECLCARGLPRPSRRPFLSY